MVISGKLNAVPEELFFRLFFDEGTRNSFYFVIVIPPADSGMWKRSRRTHRVGPIRVDSCRSSGGDVFRAEKSHRHIRRWCTWWTEKRSYFSKGSEGSYVFKGATSEMLIERSTDSFLLHWFWMWEKILMNDVQFLQNGDWLCLQICWFNFIDFKMRSNIWNSSCKLGNLPPR